MRVFGELPIDVLTLAAKLPTTSTFATLAIREFETHDTYAGCHGRVLVRLPLMTMFFRADEKAAIAGTATATVAAFATAITTAT